MPINLLQFLDLYDGNLLVNDTSVFRFSQLFFLFQVIFSQMTLSAYYYYFLSLCNADIELVDGYNLIVDVAYDE